MAAELKVLLLLMTVTAGGFDLRVRRIPNWLTVAGLAGGVGLNAVLHGGAGLRSAGLGLGVALLVYVPLFVLRGVGGGDLKLMAAVGAMVGPAEWISVFLLTAVLGGLIAVALLLLRGGLGRALRNVGFILKEMAHLRAPHKGRNELDISNPEAVTLPHAAVIALGSMLYLVAGAVSK